MNSFYYFTMDLRAKYFLKFYRKKIFNYSDPHYFISFYITSIKTNDLRPFFLYYDLNIVVTEIKVKCPFTDEFKSVSKPSLWGRRPAPYLRVELPPFLRTTFAFFDVGNFPYRILIKNIRYRLK